MAQWPTGSGDVHWPQRFAPPKNRFLLTCPKTAPSEQQCIHGKTALSSLGWQQVWEKDNSDLKPTSARCAGQTRRVKTLGPWTCLSSQEPCPSNGSTDPVPPWKVLEPEAMKRTLQQKSCSFVEKRRKRQVLDGTESRSLNSAWRRLSCISHSSVDLRQQQHSAALWATKQPSLGTTLLAPHGDEPRNGGLNKACLGLVSLASRS